MTHRIHAQVDPASSMSPDIDSISGGQMTVKMTARGATAPRARGFGQQAATAPQGMENQWCKN